MISGDELIGKRVRIVGDHPHAGNSGEIVRIGQTFFGARPVVRMDRDHMGVSECYVMRPENMEQERRKT